MKKTLQITSLVLALFFLAGCAQQEATKKDTIANPITDPVGNTRDMINLKNNAQKISKTQRRKKMKIAVRL
jgi:hypothetical protein